MQRVVRPRGEEESRREIGFKIPFCGVKIEWRRASSVDQKNGRSKDYRAVLHARWRRLLLLLLLSGGGCGRISGIGSGQIHFLRGFLRSKRIFDSIHWRNQCKLIFQKSLLRRRTECE